jgi:fumarate reductase subunit C
MPQYKTFQPAQYRPKISPYWFFERWPYLKFMVRELSCVFVAYWAVVMLVQIWSIERGAGAYIRFEHWMSNPGILILNALSLFFIMFHAVTWFMLVPRVFVRQLLGTSAIPDEVAAAPSFGAWAIASIVVGLFLVGAI